MITHVSSPGIDRVSSLGNDQVSFPGKKTLVPSVAVLNIFLSPEVLSLKPFSNTEQPQSLLAES